MSGAGGARAEAARLLDQVGLPASFVDRYPDEVSGGKLQRAGIARALATHPEVVFLDEPASALDISVRGQIFNLLLDLQRDRRLAYVVVTHELASARALADRVVVMYLGRAVEVAPAGAFFARPEHPYAAALLAAAAIGGGEGSLVTVGGDPPSAVDPPPGCPFHPRCWLYRTLREPERCRTEVPRLEGDQASRAVPAVLGGDARDPERAAACHFRAWRTDPRVVLDGAPADEPAMTVPPAWAGTGTREDS